MPLTPQRDTTHEYYSNINVQHFFNSHPPINLNAIQVLPSSVELCTASLTVNLSPFVTPHGALGQEEDLLELHRRRRPGGSSVRSRAGSAQPLQAFFSHCSLRLCFEPRWLAVDSISSPQVFFSLPFSLLPLPLHSSTSGRKRSVVRYHEGPSFHWL